MKHPRDTRVFIRLIGDRDTREPSAPSHRDDVAREEGLHMERYTIASLQHRIDRSHRRGDDTSDILSLSWI